MIRAAAPAPPLRRPVRGTGPTSGGGILVPLAAGGAGAGGLLAAQTPEVALGMGAGVVLTFLPWALLAAMVLLAATQQLVALTLGGVTVRFEQLLLLPFFIRSLLLARTGTGNRLRFPEWMLVAFVGFQIFSTYRNGFLDLRNFLPIGLVLLGALGYLTIHFSVFTRRRLLLAAKVLLAAQMVNAAVGVAAFMSQLLLGTSWGVTRGADPIPAGYGLNYESNIFGSTAAASALIFLSLWRERNPLFSKRVSLAGFVLCFLGMIASLTRGAWIGFVVALVIFFLSPRRGVRRGGGMERLALLIMMIPLIVLAAGYVAARGGPTETDSADVAGTLTGAVSEKANEAFNFESGTGRGRLIEWQTALADIKTSPIIGLGTNSYGVYHPSTGGQGRPSYIGNLWVRITYESGLIGLTIFVLFVVTVLWPNRALLFSRGDLAPIARAFTYGWLVLPVAYVGTDSMLLMWPWLLLGLTRAARTLAEQQHRSLRATARGAGNGRGNGFGPASGGNGGSSHRDGRRLALGRRPLRPSAAP
jgi:O-antigen ligase